MNYEKIYDQIIQRAKSENRKKQCGIYYEAHHIIPRCMGGSDDKLNLILLTAKEHYIAHRLLVLIYPTHTGLNYATWMMINGSIKNNNRYAPSSRIYTHLKETLSKIPKSEETKQKLSVAAKGKVFSEEHKKKLSDSKLGKPYNWTAKRKNYAIKFKGNIQEFYIDC